MPCMTHRPVCLSGFVFVYNSLLFHYFCLPAQITIDDWFRCLVMQTKMLSIFILKCHFCFVAHRMAEHEWLGIAATQFEFIRNPITNFITVEEIFCSGIYGKCTKWYWLREILSEVHLLIEWLGYIVALSAFCYPLAIILAARATQAV